MTDSPLSPGPEGLLANSTWMRNLASALVGDPHRADDVVQDTWVAVLEHPGAKPRNPRAWLSGILKNVVRQGRRTEARRLAREERKPEPEPESSAGEIVERADLHQRVVKAVVELGEPWRTALLMRYFDDLSAQEIARRLGLPSSTVRSRLHGALETLRQRLDREAGGDRRAWSLGLAGLAWPRTEAALAPATTSIGNTISSSLTASGVLAMTLKTLAVTVLALGIGFGATYALKQPASATASAEGPALAAVSGSTAHSEMVLPAAQESQDEKRRPVQEKSDGAHVVTGRVLDLDGQPIAGAHVFLGGQPSPFADVTAGVRLHHARDDERRQEEGRQAPQGEPDEKYVEDEMGELGEWRQAKAEQLVRWGGILGQTVTTDAKGAYRVRIPKKARVYATVLRRLGLRPTATGGWHELPAKDVDFKVEVIPTADLEVWLMDLTTQKKIKGFSADLYRGEESVTEWSTGEETHAQRVELPAGKTNLFRVRVWEPEWAATTQEFTVHAGSATAVEILVSSGEGFTGLVLDDLGHPVENAFVFWGETLLLRERNLFRAYELGNVRDGVRTDATGTFKLPGTAKQVSVWHADHSPASAPVAGAAVLKLPARGTIRGQLLDEAGVPLAGKSVRLDRKSFIETDEDGMFVFENVEAGVHGLHHWPERFVGVLVEPGEVTEVSSVTLIERPQWPVTSGGAPLQRDDGGIIVGMGPVFSVNEWGFEGDRIHTGHLRPGAKILMSRSGFLAVLDQVPADGAAIEVGTGSITLHRNLQLDVPPFYVVPAADQDHPMVRHWARRMFAEGDERRRRDGLEIGPLRAGRYVVIVEGRGVTKTIDLVEGEKLELQHGEWAGTHEQGGR